MQSYNITLQKSHSQQKAWTALAVVFGLLLVCGLLLRVFFGFSPSTDYIMIMSLLVLGFVTRMAVQSHGFLRVDGTVLSEQRNKRTVWQIDLKDVTRMEVTKAGSHIILVTSDGRKAGIIPGLFKSSERLKLEPVLSELLENPSIEKAGRLERGLDVWFQKDPASGKSVASTMDPWGGTTKEERRRRTRLAFTVYGVFVIALIIFVAIMASRQG